MTAPPGRLALALAGVIVSVAATIWSARADDAQDPVVAQRGDIAITAGAVRSLLKAAEPDLRQRLEHDPAAMSQFVRERLLQMVVVAEARAHKWDERPDIALRAEQARQSVIADSYIASLTPPDPSFPSEEEIQAAYEANKSRLVVPRQYHLGQIFVAVPNGAAKSTEDDAQREANDIYQQITKGRVDFAALARKSSDDHASAPNGGDLGWVREDQVVPAIRSSIAGLSEGAVALPIRIPDGWHIVKLIGTRPAGPAPMADVRETLVRALRQERQSQNARAYVAGLMKREPMQVNEIQLAKLAEH